MKQTSHGNRGLASAVLVVACLCALVNFSACSLFSQGRAVYDRGRIRIGLEADPSVRPSSQTGLYNHPIDLNPKDLEVFLQPIQISGYSGTIVGLMTKPQP